jgi:hypothetical protein
MKFYKSHQMICSALFARADVASTVARLCLDLHIHDTERITIVTLNTVVLYRY